MATRRHLRLVELALAGVLLGAIAAAVYGEYAIEGGFLSDAWHLLAIGHGFGAAGDFPATVDRFLVGASQQPRPLNAVYLAALSDLFGPHSGWWIAWLGAMSALMSLSLFALLRDLRFGAVDAGVIAVLVLIFPAASSLRLWTAVAHLPLAVAMTIIGFTIGLRAFAANGRRRHLLHGVSLLLFAGSLLLYEAALPLMLASVLLYRLRAAWKPAIKRWLIDCTVLLSIVATVTRSSSASQETQDLAGTWDHLTIFWEQSWTLLTTVVMPFGSDRWYVVALIALIPLTALLVRRDIPRDDPLRAQLTRWLLTLAGGLVVVALGYSIFVPAMDYYAPLMSGIANRVNAVPSLGWALTLYALIRLAATLALHGLPHARRWTPALAVAASTLIAVGWLQAVARDADAYERAYLEGQHVLGTIKRVIPEPPPGSTIWTFGQPLEIAPGVPIFGNTWDMTSAVQLAYDDPTISSFVAYFGTTFDCRATRVAPGGNADYASAPEFQSAYGRTYFVDTTSGHVELIQSQAQCRRAATSFPALPAPAGELAAPHMAHRCFRA